MRVFLSACVFLAACNALTGADGFDVGNASGPIAGEIPPDASFAAPPDGSVPDASTSAGRDGEADDAGADVTGPPPPPKRVFVTTDGWNGNLGGRAGADAKCAAAAGEAGLTGQWIAWLSVAGGKAIDRITHTGSYWLLDGNDVVANKAQLTSGSILHAINVTERNVMLTQNRGVWTGTRPDGNVDATCGDWTSSSSTTPLGTLASALATDGGWTKGAPQSGLADNWHCNVVVSLYCFEQ